MKKQQYKKYRNSKYKILKEKKFGESRLQALRFAVEAAIGAIQIRIAMQTPIPKFKSGGLPRNKTQIVGETGLEMVCMKSILDMDKKDICRIYNIPIPQETEPDLYTITLKDNEKTQKH